MKAQFLRDEFAARLKESLEDTDIPRNQWARTMARWLGKKEDNPMFARKWLNGDSLPLKENLQELARQLGVRAEWLEYGIGQKQALAPEKQDLVDEAVEILKGMTAEEMDRAIKILTAIT